jgi:hypothetical protein
MVLLIGLLIAIAAAIWSYLQKQRTEELARMIHRRADSSFDGLQSFDRLGSFDELRTSGHEESGLVVLGTSLVTPTRPGVSPAELHR